MKIQCNQGSLLYFTILAKCLVLMKKGKLKRVLVFFKDAIGFKAKLKSPLDFEVQTAYYQNIVFRFSKTLLPSWFLAFISAANANLHIANLCSSLEILILPRSTEQKTDDDVHPEEATDVVENSFFVYNLLQRDDSSHQLHQNYIRKSLVGYAQNL